MSGKFQSFDLSGQWRNCVSLAACRTILLKSAAVFLSLVCAACAGQISPSGVIPEKNENPKSAETRQGEIPSPRELSGFPENAPSSESALSSESGRNLARITEIERAGGFFPGLALAESGLKEKSGDFGGAALAAYKELSWAYGHGSAAREQIESGLKSAAGRLEEISAAIDGSPERQAGINAVKGCAAFVREDWKEAEEILESFLAEDEEPDSFLRWMLLVCALELNKNPAAARLARSAYGAICARYMLFPEYWYRGARAFLPEKTGAVNPAAGDENIAAVYAEQCINTSPRGPFAEECRGILAVYLGIPPDALAAQSGGARDTAPGVLSRAEIENIVSRSVSENNPEILGELFPLIALPDNPYTLYAMGAMKALASIDGFRGFFIEGGAKSRGRLGERLKFISRG